MICEMIVLFEHTSMKLDRLQNLILKVFSEVDL